MPNPGTSLAAAPQPLSRPPFVLCESVSVSFVLFLMFTFIIAISPLCPPSNMKRRKSRLTGVLVTGRPAVRSASSRIQRHGACEQTWTEPQRPSMGVSVWFLLFVLWGINRQTWEVGSLSVTAMQPGGLRAARALVWGAA